MQDIPCTDLMEKKCCWHSFRKGAATSAASVGLEDHMIQTWADGLLTAISGILVHFGDTSLSKAQNLVCTEVLCE